MSENRRDALLHVIRLSHAGPQTVPYDERIADAVIAWIDRQPVVAEEPEWDYGVIRHDGVMVNGDYTIQQTHRRRKAGPWVPVQQEGDS